jgi:uncharacterized membrane protein YoaK (UPF0700 family)
MQNHSYIIGWGVGIGAAIGTALTVASQHPAVWLPLAIGIGLAIAVAIRDRRQLVYPMGGRAERSSLPSGSPEQISDN